MKALDRWLLAGRPTACDRAPRAPLMQRHPIAAPLLGLGAFLVLVPAAITGAGVLLGLLVWAVAR